MSFDFYGTESELFAVCDCGKIWLLRADGLSAARTVVELPAEAEGVDQNLCSEIEVPNCCEEESDAAE